MMRREPTWLPLWIMQFVYGWPVAALLVAWGIAWARHKGWTL